MRGKHGKVAATRQRVAELEARAVKAERELAKVSSEYEAYRERMERQTAGLRRDVAAVLKDRDESVSPRLIEAEARAAEFRRQVQRHLNGQESARKVLQEALIDIERFTTEAMTECGVPVADVIEVRRGIKKRLRAAVLGTLSQHRTEILGARDLMTPADS